MLYLKKACCMLLCLACLMLTACASSEQIVVENDKYKIYTENGEYYLELKESVVPNKGQASVCERAPYVEFNSLAEMKSDILNGNFTEFELYEISRFVSGPICDINALLTPVYPDTLDNYTIQWSGKGYGFYFTDTNSKIQCDLSTRTQEGAEYELANRVNTYLRIDDVRVETDVERNATTYYWQPFDGREVIHCIYTIEIEGRVFSVDEGYRLEDDVTETSDVVPDNVCIFGPDINGQYYRLMIYSPYERLNKEWLASFGFVPYVEE